MKMWRVRKLMVWLACGLYGVGAVARAGEHVPAGYDGPAERLHVYLLIGQSNMAGRAPWAPEEAGVMERVYLLNGADDWEPARNPLNRYSTIRKEIGLQRLNPGYTFALAMTEADPAVTVGLVVNARGGTGIQEWARGTRFYNEALQRTRRAQQTGQLAGILWHQGEGDFQDPQYLDKLIRLIADLREDLDAPELPFVAGQIYAEPGLNVQIARLPDLVPFTGVAGSEDLRVMDRWHFDAESMRQLGRRYAEAMREVGDFGLQE